MSLGMTDEERQDARMEEAGCVPGEHRGPINVRITMGDDVRVDKFCDACEVDVEGWSYAPGVKAVELHLGNGESERFTRREGDD